MIEVEHLTKRYGDRVAVSDVAFQVKAGEIVGFLGPNGAGKSTTLRMLTGYLVPNAGSIRIHGVDAVAEPVKARKAIGYMPESVPLYKEMRVHEYLRYRAGLKEIPRRDVQARIDASLELAQVTDVKSRIIGQLSKGYRSRVGLADALLADPPLLVLDEPTAGLDPNQIRQVRDLIRSMAGKKTVLVSTHILPEVESTCSRVVIINKGRVVGEGTPEDLRTARTAGQIVTISGRADRERFEGVAMGTSGVTKLLDVSSPEDGLIVARLEVESPDTTEAIFSAFAKADLPLREIKREQTSLEDVFTRLTTTDRAEQRGAAGPADQEATADNKENRP